VALQVGIPMPFEIKIAPGHGVHLVGPDDMVFGLLQNRSDT
jgi:hypothetical protein